MNSTKVLILVAVIGGTDFFIIPLIVGAVVDGNWNPIADRYPPVPAKPTAVGRNFQSFAIGALNLGWCIHVAVDEAHLHLYPCWLARRMRVRPASIPWPAIELVRATGSSGFSPGGAGVPAGLRVASASESAKGLSKRSGRFPRGAGGPLHRNTIGSKYASARLPELPSINLRGPRWCLELATPQSH